MTATAPKLDWQADSAVSVAEWAAPKAEPARPRPVYQRELFDSRVVLQLPVYTAESGSRRPARPSRPRRRYVPPGQQAFDFEQLPEPVVAAMTAAPEYLPELLPTRQTSIYCDSPVAHPAQRLTAAVLDGSMVVIGMGLFAAMYVLCGGEVALNLTAASIFAGIGFILWFFYAALFSVCNADTPGMVWTNLRLVNFDGQQPDREQRVYRMFGGVLGFLSAGLGLIWSLVDEEHLTWHDHISKTFPSPIHVA